MQLMDGPAAAHGWPEKLMGGQWSLWIGSSQASLVPMELMPVEANGASGKQV